MQLRYGPGAPGARFFPDARLNFADFVAYGYDIPANVALQSACGSRARSIGVRDVRPNNPPTLGPKHRRALPPIHAA